MSIKQCCSLCCTSCSEYEYLQNDVGENNKIYEVTVKYFDPMLLTDEKNLNSENVQVLCGDCWFHINDFHEFQQAVLKTRKLFEEKESVKILSIEMKQENVEESKVISTQDGEQFYINEVDVANTVYVKQEDFEESEELSTQDGEKYFNTDCVVKVESYDTLQYSHEGSFVVKEEREDLNNVAKGHHYLNANTVYTGITPATSLKPSIEETNIKEKSTLKQDKANNKVEYSEENKQQNSKKSKEMKKHDLSSNLEKAKAFDAIIAGWKPELACDLCSETANTFDQMRNHFKEKHEQNCYIKCCEKKFYRRFMFANHIQLHLDPNAFKCSICGKSTSSEKNLKTHKKVVHELTKQLKCDICQKLFKQKFALEQHLLTHPTGSKEYICSECGKSFGGEQMLNYHIKRIHNPKVFCNQCGKTIHGQHNYRRHLAEHIGGNKFPCDICGIELKSPSTVKKHKAAYHNDGSTIFVCGVCGKVARSRVALLSHKQQVHSRKARHKCTYCDKTFKATRPLREHIATHTGQDLYQCPHCPQTFKTSATIHYHRKKVHPVEWEESHKNSLQKPKININRVNKQVVI